MELYSTNPHVNGKLDARSVMDTGTMEWTASPSGTVWRKRVHLVGPPEAGQVTSLVRYEPDSRFPAHEHPDGEEILVLDGVFSDEHGDWPAGTYLLNPQGFRHAPYSQPGCLLFVKLRQYPGTDRQHVVIKTAELEWQAGPLDGVSVKPLYRQPGYDDSVELQRWEAGTRPGPVSYPGGVEYFVIEGQFEDEKGLYRPGSWLRLPEGSSHEPGSVGGCEVYVKTGGLRYLQDAADVEDRPSA